MNMKLKQKHGALIVVAIGCPHPSDWEALDAAGCLESK